MLPQEWTATQVHTWELVGVSPVNCLLGTTAEVDEDLHPTEAGRFPGVLGSQHRPSSLHSVPVTGHGGLFEFIF